MYDVLNRVMKNRFFMLLINFWNDKIDDKCDENEEIKKSYFIVERNERENVVNVFDLEIISVHDIEIFYVLKEENDAVVVIVTEDLDENKKINEVIIEKFFACFVRSYLCSLMLFTNLTKQRLHAYFLVDINFSWCCCSYLQFEERRKWFAYKFELLFQFST